MYTPKFQGPIEGWTANHLKANYWKVERTMTRADCMQEAYLVFHRCQTKYPQMDTPQHFMALYKTAWSRAFVDFANADTASRIVTEMPRIQIEDELIEYDPPGDLGNEGYFAVLLREAPKEVLMVLHLFLSAPKEVLDLALAGWKGPNKRERTGGSSHLNRMLGLPPDLDVLQMTKDYFKNQ